MVIVSITPEIALEGSVNYAGGLGVLEGDKFYAAGDLGLDYLVLSLLYKQGYVKLRFTVHGEPLFEPEELSREFYSKLTPDGELVVTLNNARVYVIPWVYRYKTAKAVLFEAVCPEWARKLNSRVYVDDNEEEKFLKYALLAKASASYLKEKVGLENIAILDLEESYTSLVLYELRGIESKTRIILHTPGPWGHPVFPGYMIKQEFGVDVSEGLVNMTEETLRRLSKAIVVSKKQCDVMSHVFPDHRSKFIPITNGIYLERWMHPKLYSAWVRKDIREEVLREVRNEAKKELLSLVKYYKPEVDLTGKVVVTWARRLARYKRPYFIARFIEEHHDQSVVYILAGKPHPKDPDGYIYLKKFKELSQKFNNVVYIPDYRTDVAKVLMAGSDIWLFTPFSGWEACGTSYMKALVNGVPVVSSRDGGVIEIVEDNLNGWLFGDDIREFINIYEDPRARTIDEKDYKEFSNKLTKAIETYYGKPDEYWTIALNAWRDVPEKVDIRRVLRKYYLEKLPDDKQGYRSISS
ncbi:MAG: glycogen/starch/alpha-glucan phosphorylase [Desulfurococcaceae archaeon]|jgi:starch phosphorylase